jgi:hypothetical protein
LNVNPYQSPSESASPQAFPPESTRGWSLRKLLVVLGFLPLLIYPVVLVAGIMALAAPRTGDEPQLQIILSHAIVVGWLVYPVVYCPCAWISESLNEKSKCGRLAEALSFAPLVYLSAVSLLLLAAGWAAEDSIRETHERWEKYGKSSAFIQRND